MKRLHCTVTSFAVYEPVAQNGEENLQFLQESQVCFLQHRRHLQILLEMIEYAYHDAMDNPITASFKFETSESRPNNPLKQMN